MIKENIPPDYIEKEKKKRIRRENKYLVVSADIRNVCFMMQQDRVKLPIFEFFNIPATVLPHNQYFRKLRSTFKSFAIRNKSP